LDRSFFTAAGYSTFFQVINADERSSQGAAARFWAWKPRELA
jgi:hypothetical protein